MIFSKKKEPEAPRTAQESQTPQAMYYTPPVEPKRTYRGLFAEKLLDAFERARIRDIVVGMIDTLMFVVLASFLVFPSPTLYFIHVVMSFYGYALPKVFFAIMLIVALRNRKEVYLFFFGRPRAGNQHTIEGVPKSELLLHLFRCGSFKQNDVTGGDTSLALSDGQYRKLASGLKRAKILVTGENNANVLNPDYSRAFVKVILDRADSAKDLHPLHDGDGWNGLTKKEIEESLTEELEEEA